MRPSFIYTNNDSIGHEEYIVVARMRPGFIYNNNDSIGHEEYDYNSPFTIIVHSSWVRGFMYSSRVL